MMSSEIFEEFVRTHLGCSPINPTTCARGSLGIINWLRTEGEVLIGHVRNISPKVPPIHLDFYESDEANAGAFMYQGRYFIGISVAAAIGMPCLFKRMLSDGRILTHVGNPENEHEHRLLSRPILPSLLLDIRQHGDSPDPKGHRLEFLMNLSL